MRPLIILAALVATILADSTINPPECGRRPYANKVVGGTKADPKDWGWQVSMNFNFYGFICGGSVLNSEWIITAAHCVDGYLNPSYYSFDIGHHDRNNIESWAVSRKVTKVIAHPSYSDRTLQNDIALMKLDKPLTYTDEIVPVCIPDGSVDFAGKSSWATGWGTLTSGGSVSRYLMQVEMPFLTDSRCKQKYSSVNTKVAVCAGETGENKDTCQGDSGGPLVVENNNRWELAGITSWGYGCGDGGVYTRTSYYYNWIQQQISNN